MTPAQALLVLYRRGWSSTIADGHLRLQPPRGDRDAPEATAAIGVLRGHREEAVALAAWPSECLESAVRFGHHDALLYPLLGREVETPTGIAVLVQVIGGRAIVSRGVLDETERLRVSEVGPVHVQGADGRAG